MMQNINPSFSNYLVNKGAPIEPKPSVQKPKSLPTAKPVKQLRKTVAKISQPIIIAPVEKPKISRVPDQVLKTAVEYKAPALKVAPIVASKKLWHHHFIPSEHNQYHPTALKSKRLYFHAVSAVAIKATCLLFAMMLPIEAWMMPDNFGQQAQTIIEKTNQIRISAGQKPLKSNVKLMQAAKSKADDMILNQYFAHISPQGQGLAYWLRGSKYKYDSAGENLAIGFTSPDAALLAWRLSPTHYANLVDPDFSEVGVSVAAGQLGKTDTSVVAQLFGKPQGSPVEKDTNVNIEAQKLLSKLFLVVAKEKSIVTTTALAQVPTKETKVLGVKEFNQPNTAEQTVRSVGNIATTKLQILSLGDNKKLVSIEAAITQRPARAQVSLYNRTIDLNSVNPNSKLWTKTEILYLSNVEMAAATAPASLSVWYADGTGQTTDINSTILPATAGLTAKYQMIKNNPTPQTKVLFQTANYYYLGLLAALLFLITAAVVFEFKHQHPRLIFESIGLVLLLGFLIVI
ncbi:MAG: CAP domain-containing protein [Candidatus Falkowbacteria bacterium]